jgi:hypothetical protein
MTGGTGGVPDECSVPVSEPGPYPTTIRLINPSDTPLWVRQDCQITWQLFQCADGYTDPVATTGDCTIDCSESGNGCIACGACMLVPLLVEPGAALDIEWSGYTYEYSQKQGCSCHVESVAPPAKYAVRVPVYSNVAEAESGESGWDAWTYFDLPAETGIVEVVLVGVK